MRTIMLAAAAVSFAQFNAAHAADATIDDLIAMIPDDANAVQVVDVTAMMNSPIAKANKWEAMHKLQAADRQIAVPLGATHFVRGASMDLRNGGIESAVAAVKFEQPVTADAIAQAETGHTDRFGDLDVAWSPRDFYAVVFSDTVAGAYRPANRQAAARWAEQAASASVPEISSNLQTPLKLVDLSKSPVFFAIDLQGVISAPSVLPQLAESELLKANNIDSREVAELLASTKWVSLSVELGEEATGTITANFGRDAGVLAPIAMDAVTAALKARGAYLNELPEWKANVSGNTLVASGPLKASGLRRVGALLHTHSPDTNTATPEGHAELTAPEATKRHYQAVSQLIDDAAKTPEAVKISDVAVYLDRYAAKIDGLPILNVDPEVAAWSEWVAAQFREASYTVNDARNRTAQKASEHANFWDTEDSGGAPTRTAFIREYHRDYDRDYYRNYHGNDSRYRYSSGRTYEPYEYEVAVDRYRSKYQREERKKVAIQEQAQGRQDARGILKEVQNSQGDIRRRMTEKYKIEF